MNLDRARCELLPAAALGGRRTAEARADTPEVWCIIVNWNGWRHTLQCLASLKKSTYEKLTLVVVDNGSTNDSVARIRSVHPEILLLESNTNLGFAGGNNIGIRRALTHGADYVWLLNNDTDPAPDALAELVAKALTNRRIGAVASICYYADAPGTFEAWGGARVNLWIGFGRNSTRPRPDDWFHSLNGTSMLVSRAALEDAGLLDEAFFLYWEDTEFCLRLRKKGWRLAAASGSRVLHKVHGSSGGNPLILDRHQTASGLRLLRLHSPFPRLSMFLFLAMRFSKRILRLQFARSRGVWAGIREYREKLTVAPRIR
jgi:GT2 family glycosyltransferase